MKDILAVIPARGGSKSIPRKNLANLLGSPLIKYSIDVALNSNRITRTIVSTDDEEISKVSQECGAEIPFLRPAHLSEDTTTILPVLIHLLETLKKNELYEPWAIMLLQPTSPMRSTEDIDRALSILCDNDADSVVSVCQVPHAFNPVSLMKIDNNILSPYAKGEGTKVLRRQDKPKVYARNGPAILATKSKTLLEQQDLYGEKSLPYVMDQWSTIDIDEPFDFHIVEWMMARNLKI